MTLELFLQHFFNALTLGSLYGLIAIGYTMVYGILRLINFAHGDILMLGAYFVFYGTTLFCLPWPIAVVHLPILRRSILYWNSEFIPQGQPLDHFCSLQVS